MQYSQFLNFTEETTNKARKLTLELWEDPDLGIELKHDNSPVTKLDRKIEEMFREDVKKKFPDHGVLGEEFGLTNGDREFLWVIDPIDGTQSLVNRVPTFGTFLALLHKQEPVLGVIDIPVLNRRVIGAVGDGVRDERGRKIDLSLDRKVSSSDILALGTSGSFVRGGDEEVQRLAQKKFPTARAYYDCFGHYLVATGGISGLLEMNIAPWDIVATEALVKAAGGTVHYLKKDPAITGLRSTIAGRPSMVSTVQSLF